MTLVDFHARSYVRSTSWAAAGLRLSSAAEGTKRLAYQLTEKGRALRPLLAAMRDWGLKWEPGTVVGMKTYDS